MVLSVAARPNTLQVGRSGRTSGGRAQRRWPSPSRTSARTALVSRSRTSSGGGMGGSAGGGNETGASGGNDPPPAPALARCRAQAQPLTKGVRFGHAFRRSFAEVAVAVGAAGAEVIGGLLDLIDVPALGGLDQFVGSLAHVLGVA